MTGTEWTTHEQKAFLKGNVPVYEKAQMDGRPGEMLDRIGAQFEEKWPSEDDKALKSRRQQIRAWYNNHTGVRGDKAKSLPKFVKKSVKSLIATGGRRKATTRKRRSRAQAYTNLFYDEKMKDEVKRKLAEQVEDARKKGTPLEGKALSGARLAIIADLATEQLKTASSEVLEQVEKRRAEYDGDSIIIDEEDEREGDISVEERKRRANARNRQELINNAIPVLQALANNLFNEAGCVSFFMIAGPEPDLGGKITISAVSTGRTREEDLSFEAFHPSFDKNVPGIFQRFAERCYTREERREISLTEFVESDESDEEEETATPKNQVVDRGGSTEVDGRRKSGQTDKGKKKSKRRAGKEVANTSSKTNGSREENVDSNSSDEDIDESKLSGVGSSDEATESSSDSDEDDGTVVKAIRTRVASNGENVYLMKEGGPWVTQYEYDRLQTRAANIRLFRDMGHEDPAYIIKAKKKKAPKEKVHIPQPPPRAALPRKSKDGPVNYTDHLADLAGENLDVSHDTSPSEDASRSRDIGNSDGEDHGRDDNLRNLEERRTPSVASSTDRDQQQLPAIESTVDEIGSVVEGTVLPTGERDSGHSVDLSLPGNPVAVQSSVPGTLNTSTENGNRRTSPSDDDVEPTAGLSDGNADEGRFLTPTRSHTTPPEIGSLDESGTNEGDNQTEGQSSTTTVSVTSHPPSAGQLESARLVATSPEWLKPSMEVLVSEFGDEDGQVLLSRLVQFERSCDKQVASLRLTTDSRPEQIRYFLSRGRDVKTSKAPPLSFPMYAKEMRDWWMKLQPSWRIRTSDGTPSWPLSTTQPRGRRMSDLDDWAEVRKGGPNGVYLVVMGLLWWKINVVEPQYKRELDSVMEDVSWVLDEVLKSEASALIIRKKRAAEDDKENKKADERPVAKRPRRGGSRR